MSTMRKRHTRPVAPRALHEWGHARKRAVLRQTRWQRDRYGATIAQNLRRIRTERGLRQEDVARRLGILSEMISYWECRRSMPNLWSPIQLADALGVSLDVLCGRTRRKAA